MPDSTEAFQRRGDWWQEGPDGTWLKWNEAANEWQQQEAPPPPTEHDEPIDSPSTVGPPSTTSTATRSDETKTNWFSKRVGLVVLGGIAVLAILFFVLNASGAGGDYSSGEAVIRDMEANGMAFDKRADPLETFEGDELDEGFGEKPPPADIAPESGAYWVADQTQEEVVAFTLSADDSKAFAEWTVEEELAGALVEGGTYAVILGSNWVVWTGPETAPLVIDAIGGELQN